MKCLVTGGAGFMGSHLVDELFTRGHEVISIDNFSGTLKSRSEMDIPEGPTTIFADIRDKYQISKAMKDVDIVYHLAAYAAEGQSFFSPIEINDINLRGTDTVLVSAINAGVKKIVFTSSMAVYGHQTPPFNESMPRLPADPYAAAKAYAENLLEIFHDIYGIDYTILRPHNVYGPRQNIADAYRNVLGIWMNQILRSKPMTIYGDGTQTRAFSYIKDVTPAIANAGFYEKANSEIINVGSEEEVAIRDAALMIATLAEYYTSPKYETDRPGEVKYAYCTTEKSKNILDYKTNYSLQQGLTEMWDWAKRIGPQEPTYKLPLEIIRNAPAIWKERRI